MLSNCQNTGIFVSYPRRRVSSEYRVDSRLRGNDKCQWFLFFNIDVEKLFRFRAIKNPAEQLFDPAFTVEFGHRKDVLQFAAVEP